MSLFNKALQLTEDELDRILSEQAKTELRETYREQHPKAAAPASALDWIPLITALGEQIFLRILDSSPDTKSALDKADANWDETKQKAQEWRQQGHESDGE